MSSQQIENAWGSMFAPWLYWMIEGVNHSLEGNGGPECLAFLSPTRKLVETLVFLALGFLEIYVASRYVTLPAKIPPERRHANQMGDRTSKKLLLAGFCIIFGIELGYKLATKQVIWLFNPCHIITMTQIYLLIAPPTRTTMAIFRLHMHALGGATIAVLLPVVNTRMLPFETEIYFIQHIGMLLIPFYLMRLGGVYTTERLTDFSWALMSCGILFVYHWTFMQTVGIVTMVNLNNMLCPAVSDPFHGPWYRVCAVVHQTLLIHVHGKVLTLLVRLVVRIPAGDQSAVEECNGHAKAQ